MGVASISMRSLSRNAAGRRHKQGPPEEALALIATKLATEPCRGQWQPYSSGVDMLPSQYGPRQDTEP